MLDAKIRKAALQSCSIAAARRSGAARRHRLLDQVIASARLRDGEEQLILELQLPAVDGDDAGRRRCDRNAEMALDQELAEGRGVPRAAARTGDDDLRGPAFEP